MPSGRSFAVSRPFAATNPGKRPLGEADPAPEASALQFIIRQEPGAQALSRIVEKGIHAN
jgi:hypothetical protein